MKKTISMTVIILLLLSVVTYVSYAAGSVSVTASVNNTNKVVTIKGNISSGSGQQVTVLVVNPSGGTDYVDQVTSSVNGEYQFTYTLDEAAGGTYAVTIGGTGIESPVSTEFTYAPSTDGSDTTAPIWPTGSTVSASNVSTTGLTLSWSAAQDNTAVVNYKIYKGSDLLQIVSGNVTSHEVSGLTWSTNYTFKIEAGDAAGNWSIDGPALTVTTSNRRSSGGSGNSSTTPTPTTEQTAESTAVPATESTTESTTAPTPTSVESNFTDVDSEHSWAKEAIDTLYSKGIIKGTSSTTFEPEKNITRADFVVLLVRALGLKADIDTAFADVDQDAYYYEAIGIAKKLGITTGVDGLNFNPKGEISRQDMMVLVARALKAANKLSTEGRIEDLRGYQDASDVADYAADSVAALVKEGIIKGNGNSINPNGTAIRAEVAVIIYRIYSR